MKKVVINKCFGGFVLSPEALLWMYERGAKELATPVEEYYHSEIEIDKNNILSKRKSMERWQKYQDGPKEKRDSLFVVTFSPDMKYVLSGG